MKKGWSLLSAESLAKRHDSFEIPHAIERHNLRVGQTAKLLFRFPEGPVERMWVEIIKVLSKRYRGQLRSHPLHYVLQYDDEVTFAPRHVASLWVGDLA